MILKKYDKKTKEDLKNFLVLKDLQCNNLDWCKWAGWFDTDGYIPKKNRKITLSLSDKQPVELLSKFMESTIYYAEHETITPEPYRNKYIAKEFITTIGGEKSIFFIKKIYPYMLNEEKKLRACKILGYQPESKKLDDWTKEEVVSYVATALEGDGNIVIEKRKRTKDYLRLCIDSSNAEYLSLIKYLIDKQFNTCINISEVRIYKTKKGLKAKYKMYLPNIDELHKMLAVNNIMTLDRKRNKILYYINQGQ